jgi:hypothetical protein
MSTNAFVHREHVHEIFSVYGTVSNVDMPVDHRTTGMNRGFAYVEYETGDDAAKAYKHMDGGALTEIRLKYIIKTGQIDGQEITVAFTLEPNKELGGRGARDFGGSFGARRRDPSPGWDRRGGGDRRGGPPSGGYRDRRGGGGGRSPLRGSGGGDRRRSPVRSPVRGRYVLLVIIQTSKVGVCPSWLNL